MLTVLTETYAGTAIRLCLSNSDHYLFKSLAAWTIRIAFDVVVELTKCCHASFYDLDGIIHSHTIMGIYKSSFPCL